MKHGMHKRGFVGKLTMVSNFSTEETIQSKLVKLNASNAYVKNAIPLCTVYYYQLPLHASSATLTTSVSNYRTICMELGCNSKSWQAEALIPS